LTVENITCDSRDNIVSTNHFVSDVNKHTLARRFKQMTKIKIPLHFEIVWYFKILLLFK